MVVSAKISTTTPRPQPGTYGTGAEARPDMGCYEADNPAFTIIFR